MLLRKEGITVLSLFDGMSCGRIALDRANIPVKKYYASEIDKWAIKVSKDNYPDIIQLGDIENWKEWGIDWAEVDLVIGGSPCQGFSMAGKQLAFDDPRSKLFFTFVEILNYVSQNNLSVKFLLENVRMGAEVRDKISELMRVEPSSINSRLVSAQNRPRLYWTNIPHSIPDDKNIILDDIIVDKRFECVTSANNGTKIRYTPLVMHNSANGLKCVGALTSERSSMWNKNGRALQRNFKQGYRVYCTSGKSPTLNSNGGGLAGNSSLVKHGNKIRKLTPIECERLQTVPDNYTACVSDTQRYKMLGNGWTVDVIAHIFEGLKEGD